MALALTTRRSTVAAVASAIAAMALAAAVAGRSCRVSQRGPEAAVRDMLQAARTGDLDTAFELLSPRTRARLEAQARRATDLVGASERFAAKALLSMGSAEGIPAPTDITVVKELDDRATVEIVSPGVRSRIELIRVRDRWLVDLPAYGGTGAEPEPVADPAPGAPGAL